MGRYVDGKYYENFTQTPEFSNKITKEQKEFNKIDINEVRAGIVIVKNQMQKQIGQKPDIEINDYIESFERTEPIEYVFMDKDLGYER